MKTQKQSIAQIKSENTISSLNNSSLQSVQGALTGFAFVDGGNLNLAVYHQGYGIAISIGWNGIDGEIYTPEN